MSKWIAEFDLEDGDTMPEHMDLNYMGAKIDFHCRPMWIPVSERLPEIGSEVLTCSNGGFIEIQSLEENYGGYWENQKGDWSDFDEIIAWMPLPEPSRQKARWMDDKGRSKTRIYNQTAFDK